MIQIGGLYFVGNKVHRISHLILPHFAVKCSPWIKEKPLIIKHYQRFSLFLLCFCDPLGARTQDPNIKSVVLYQLS